MSTRVISNRLLPEITLLLLLLLLLRHLRVTMGAALSVEIVKTPMRDTTDM